MFRKLALALSISVLTGPAIGGDLTVDSAIGGAVGGAIGGAIGAELGGREGAIAGAGIGAAAGTAINTREHRHYGYGGPHPSGFSYYGPPRGRFCPPGLAMQGRC